MFLRRKDCDEERADPGGCMQDGLVASEDAAASVTWQL